MDDVVITSNMDFRFTVDLAQLPCFGGSWTDSGPNVQNSSLTVILYCPIAGMRVSGRLQGA